MPEPFDRRAARWLPALFALPVLIYLALALFVRYLADDYCLGLKIGQFGGLAQAVFEDYAHWSGRYSYSAMSYALGAPGLPWIMVSTFGLQALWLAGLAWACAEVCSWLGAAHQWRIGAGLALIVLLATFSGTPELIQSLYWASGQWVYAAPAATLPLLAALLLRGARLNWRGRRLWAGAGAAALLSVYAAGFTEPHTAVQLGGLALALLALAVLRVRRRAACLLLAVSLLATVIATVVLVAAPGNAVRASHFEQQSLITAAVNAVIHAAAFVASSMLYFSPLGAAAAFVMPALLVSVIDGALPKVSQHAALTGMAICLLTGLVLISGFMLPGFYATSQPPPARSYIIPQFIWMCALAATGIFAGLRLRRSRQARPLRLAGAVLGAVAVAALCLHAAGFAGPLSQHAAAWDQRDAEIRAAVASGVTALAVQPLALDLAAAVGLESIGEDADNWVNRCAAEWYGLQRLWTRPPIS